jgi:hypothetical protein
MKTPRPRKPGASIGTRAARKAKRNNEYRAAIAARAAKEK